MIAYLLLNGRLKNLAKTVWILVVLLGSLMNVQAQESILLQGRIISTGGDRQNVHIVNLSKETGTTSDSNGGFQMLVSEGDSLYFSSVQFQNKSIMISKTVVENAEVTITLEETFNELAEVFIDDIQLSGYLGNDLNLISIKEVETKNRLQQNLDAYIEKDRELNPYHKQSITSGIRIDKIAMALAEKISGNKESPVVYDSSELANLSLKIVGEQFFREDLDLEPNEICNFLRYCDRDGNFQRLVLHTDALVLIEYFQEKIDSFREWRAEGLNASRHLPG